MILKYSNTEYLIHCPIGESGLYYLLSEIARKNGGKVEARSWLPVGLRRDTYFGISLTSQEE